MSDKPRGRSRKRGVAVNGMLLTGSVLFALLLVEGFLWLAMPVKVHRITSERYRASLNPNIAYEPRPLVRDHNRDGLRDYDYSREKPAGVFRIVVAGDSLAYGLGVPLADTYAKQLERLLNTGGGNRYQVINLGVPGYRITQVVARLAEKGLAYRPDMIIYGYWLDDIAQSSDREEAALVRVAGPGDDGGALFLSEEYFDRLLPGLLLESQIFRRAVVTWRHLRSRPRSESGPIITPEKVVRELGRETAGIYLEYYSRVRRGVYRDLAGFEPYYQWYADYDNFVTWNRELRRFSGLCRENDLDCLLLLTPVLYEHGGEYNWRHLHKMIGRVAGHYGLAILDLQPVLDRLPVERVALPGDPEHPSSFGCRVIAANLQAYLRKRLAAGISADGTDSPVFPPASGPN